MKLFIAGACVLLLLGSGTEVQSNGPGELYTAIKGGECSFGHKYVAFLVPGNRHEPDGTYFPATRDIAEILGFDAYLIAIPVEELASENPPVSEPDETTSAFYQRRREFRLAEERRIQVQWLKSDVVFNVKTRVLASGKKVGSPTE